MIVARVFLLIIFYLSSSVYAYEDNVPITTDNRIKTYIYNPNEVYLLVLHVGFQSYIEVDKNEQIQTIVLGDTYAWKMNTLGNRIFINTLEKNVRTNMTIITNKRLYEFDLVSKEIIDNDYTNVVYAVKFYYPKTQINR
ncbi:MAG: TrbG/VirB9 family P-type conjugative transfer protein [Rickettsiaceae bacterium]